MSIDPGDPRAEQFVPVQQAENLLVVRRDRCGQALKIAKNLWPGSKISASDLTDYEGMRQDMPVQKRFTELWITLPEVVHPN